MTREEADRAIATLAAAPAARWISTKLADGSVLCQKCMRCGAEQTITIPLNVTEGFDEKLFTWKRSFQVVHESCVA